MLSLFDNRTLVTLRLFLCLQVVKLLYDDDVIEEDAVLVWADEKQMADEDERKYLRKAAAFIAWLREAESEEDTTSVESD